RRRLEPGIARQPVRLAERHGTDSVTVEVGIERAAGVEVAARLLVLDEGIQPATHGVLVPALDGVDVSRAQQRQEGQSGSSAVRLAPTTGRAWVRLALLLEVHRPRAVRSLVPDEPLEPALHGLLRVDRTPLASDHLGPAQPLTARERGRDLFGESG